jgi:hypothetical protein
MLDGSAAKVPLNVNNSEQNTKAGIKYRTCIMTCSSELNHRLCLV